MKLVIIQLLSWEILNYDLSNQVANQIVKLLVMILFTEMSIFKMNNLHKIQNNLQWKQNS